MKFSINVSNTGLMVIMALVLGALLITDINAHRMPNAYAPSDVANRVVTKEFVLVDDQGATRARIGMNDKGSPCMQLFDRRGQQRAQLRLNGDDVPSLRLYDASGTLRSAMSFNLGTLEPGFVLFDQNGVGSWLNQMNTVSVPGPVYDEDAPHSSGVVQQPYLWAGPDREATPVTPRDDMALTPRDGIIHLDLRSDIRSDINR